MKVLKRMISVLLCAACLLVCTGCKEEVEQQEQIETETNPYADLVGMEDIPTTEYDVPKVLPNILSDAIGYDSKGEKYGYVKGTDLPDTFYLINAASGVKSYTGEIKNIKEYAEDGIKVGTLDFTEFDEEGIYYLECDRLGQSVSFAIRQDFYTKLFREELKTLTESCRKKELTLQEAMDLLLTYEWYEESFPDEDADKCPDVLKDLQYFMAAAEENGVLQEEKAYYVAFLAKYSFLSQNFDMKFARSCLQRATDIFETLEDSNEQSAYNLFALTELFRATNKSTYQKMIASYKNYLKKDSSYLSDTAYMYATMTYMATRQGVDTSLCEYLMSYIMHEAESVFHNYKDLSDPMEPCYHNEEDLMCQTEILSCANYVMNNYQYTRAIKSILHHCSGQNKNFELLLEKNQYRGKRIMLLAQMSNSNFEQ